MYKGEKTAFIVHPYNKSAMDPKSYCYFFVQCLLLVAIASLSLVFIEKSINNLKKYLCEIKNFRVETCDHQTV
jgi:hypothetical protein